MTFIFLINVPQVVEVSEKTKDYALMLFNWEEFSSNSPSDPAFDVVYEVISWIALSNCLHFALKKVVRIVADGFGRWD